MTRISVAIGLVALVATVSIVGVNTILHHLRAIGWFFLVLIAIEIASAVLDGTAIYFMAHGEGQPRWREAVVAQLAGRGVNAVTPGGNLGEALKVGLLSQHCSPRRIVAAVMYVGLISLALNVAVVAIGSAATAFLFAVPPLGMAALLAAALIAAAITVAIVVLIRRGMLSTFSRLLARIRVISPARRDRWHKTLSEIDERLRGHDDEGQRRRAIACIVVSRLIQKGGAYLTIWSAGYALSAGQFMALLSAGAIIQWIATIIPMGLGASEGGNVALFAVIGAPASLGLALAFARRVNQIVFAGIGFAVLAIDRLHGQLARRQQNYAERLPFPGPSS